MRLVAAGQTGPEIADHLHISHATVRTHVRNAMAKVGARSRAHLVAKALGDGHACAEHDAADRTTAVSTRDGARPEDGAPGSPGSAMIEPAAAWRRPALARIRGRGWRPPPLSPRLPRPAR